MSKTIGWDERLSAAVGGKNLVGHAGAVLLRPGSAGSNTVSGHIRVLGEAIARLPPRCQHKILIRADGAGATHELLDHLTQMNTLWRRVRFTVGWAITDIDEKAIAAVPESDWTGSPPPTRMGGQPPRLAWPSRPGWTSVRKPGFPGCD
ncbi:MAG: hypothetical protein HKP61_09375 [Dactylosporangium sp.]|nr:transposase [Dactylosporangium sp.]NNJ61142.1 hypothetical protein [Dactylosporangium sp.]